MEALEKVECWPISQSGTGKVGQEMNGPQDNIAGARKNQSRDKKRNKKSQKGEKRKTKGKPEIPAQTNAYGDSAQSEDDELSNEELEAAKTWEVGKLLGVSIEKENKHGGPLGNATECPNCG